MATQTSKDLDVKLAVYMERLDTYIESQTKLNEALCESLSKVSVEVDKLQGWKDKMGGMKTAFVAVGLLFLHTTAVMGGLIAFTKWFLSGDK